MVPFREEAARHRRCRAQASGLTNRRTARFQRLTIEKTNAEWSRSERPGTTISAGELFNKKRGCQELSDCVE